MGTTCRAAVRAAPPRGSPPRVWGQRPRLRVRSGAHRFTPTRVGTTATPSPTPPPPTVHPHACGDNAGAASTTGRPLRFTPTRVGTTRDVAYPDRPHAVHPHACGDNAAAFIKRHAENGSPPRVWGQLLPRGVERGFPRFTPTRVGTTTIMTSMLPRPTGSPPRVWGQRLPPRTAAAARSVHPHACGDNVCGPRRNGKA